MTADGLRVPDPQVLISSAKRPSLHRSHLRTRSDAACRVATWRLYARQPVYKALTSEALSDERKWPLTCTYVVAGAGFEPATFGL